MTDELFRIVITVAVALACLAFLVQTGIAIALYRVARKMQAKISPLADRAAPVIDKAGPVIDKIGPVLDKAGPVVENAGNAIATTNRILLDTRPRIAEISQEVSAIVKSGRQQVERIGALVNDAGDRARDRLAQIDETVDSTVEQVEQVGETMKKAVMRPVREVNGIAAGISAAVTTLVRGPRKSSVDHATQDEEMFI